MHNTKDADADVYLGGLQYKKQFIIRFCVELCWTNPPDDRRARQITSNMWRISPAQSHLTLISVILSIIV